MAADSLHEEIFPRPLSGARIDVPPPALVPPRLTISGEHVTLEPLDPDRHAKELFEAGHSDEEALHIWDYMRYGPWPDLASYKTALRQQSASLDTIFYAIRPHEAAKVCGQASFLDIHPQDGVIEIGHIWFSPQLRRTRAATEALFLLLCQAMDDLGYRRMQWRCNALNENSRNAARRLGFRFEGICHNNLIFKGMNRDTAWYSILDNEWPEVRELIATWLSPDNFDPSGTAKSSLSQAMKQRQPGPRPV